MLIIFTEHYLLGFPDFQRGKTPSVHGLSIPGSAGDPAGGESMPSLTFISSGLSGVEVESAGIASATTGLAIQYNTHNQYYSAP